jgi:hypothetical protein
MSNTFQRVFFPSLPPADLKDIRHTTYPQGVQYDPIISIQQIRTAVNKTAPSKAPGPDGITNLILKQALLHIEKWLQKLLQASLDLGYFPKAFKETTTVVLRKPGKPDYSKSKAYRPIALENTIGKVFESVIAEIMSYLTETNELLPAHHYGGRLGRSAEDAMMSLLLEMEASGTFCYTHSYQLYINPRSFPSIDTSIATGCEPGDALLTPTCSFLLPPKSLYSSRSDHRWSISSELCRSSWPKHERRQSV